MRTKEEINKNVPKFNKKKCAKCKWRGYGHGGYLTKVGEDKDGKDIVMHVYCNYTSLNNKSCIQRKNKNNPYDVYDIRGDEYNHCLLFEEGPYREDVKKNISITKEG